MKALSRLDRRPEVTILCLTYNHAPYIEDAIRSFIAQKGIDFEVIVADDASSDGTSEIVEQYARQYPKIIRHVRQERNVGAEGNFHRACRDIRGKFVAICDGDDFFLTEDKISKQAKILKLDETIALCFSYARMIFEQQPQMERLTPNPESISDNRRFSLQSIRETNLVPACTVMYRWLFRESPVENFVPRGILPGDYYLHLMHAKSGDLAFLNEVTAVYRRHPNGMWWDYDREWDAQNLKHGLAELRFHLSVSERIFEGADQDWYENNRVIPFMALLIRLNLKHARLSQIQEIHDIAPEFFKSAVSRLEVI